MAELIALDTVLRANASAVDLAFLFVLLALALCLLAPRQRGWIR